MSDEPEDELELSGTNRIYVYDGEYWIEDGPSQGSETVRLTKGDAVALAKWILKREEGSS